MDVSLLVAVLYFLSGPLGVLFYSFNYTFPGQNLPALVYGVASLLGTITWVLASRFFVRVVTR